MITEPMEAYQVAYDLLIEVPFGCDELRQQVARQIVDTVKQARSERGLAWLRKIDGSYIYLNELIRISNEIGRGNLDMLLGRMKLSHLYEAVAKTFIAAYGRTRK